MSTGTTAERFNASRTRIPAMAALLWIARSPCDSMLGTACMSCCMHNLNLLNPSQVRAYVEKGGDNHVCKQAGPYYDAILRTFIGFVSTARHCERDWHLALRVQNAACDVLLHNDQPSPSHTLLSLADRDHFQRRGHCPLL